MEILHSEANKKIYSFITGHPLATVATTTKSEIHMAHVFAFSDEILHFYFMSRPSHRKVLNIQDNGIITLFFSDQTTIEQVECIGTADIVTDPSIAAKTLGKLQDIYTIHKRDYWIPPLAQMKDAGYAIVKVTPTSLTYRSYQNEDKDSSMTELKAEL